MKKNAFILFVLMLVSKLFGIVREIAMTYFLGSGIYTDAYITAGAVPNVLFGLIATGLVSTFIPIYSQIIHKEGKERAKKYLDNILTIVFFISLAILVFGLLFTEPIVRLMAPGYVGEAFKVTVQFTQISLFALLTNGIFNIIGGFQQYHGRFYVAPIGGFFMNIVVISTIVISSFTKPVVLAYGLVLGAFAQFIVTYTIARIKGGYKYKPTLNLKDEYLKPMIIMAIPIIFGSSINQINGIIDGSLASTLGTGARSNLNYATKLSQAVYSLFVASITTVMYPEIIKLATKKDFDGLKKNVISIMNTVSLIIIPASVGMIVLAHPVVNLFFGRGKMSEAALIMTAGAVIFTSVGLIGLAINDVLVRAFYALQDSITPVVSGVVSVIINIVLNFTLAPIMGVSGLALATSVSSIFGSVFLYFRLRKKLGGLPVRAFIRSVLKISFSALLMGLIVYFSYQYLSGLDISSIIPLGVSVGLGVITYVAGIWILKVDEFTELISIISNRLKKRTQ